MIQDYDCFYAAVFEAENPVLKSLPLAVQQKHIIVTCNYEARKRGLQKLQLIKEARKACPDVIIVLGEDLTRFRNASKELYNFLRGFVWSQKAERLGFDEVFLDVTDLVDYNLKIINYNCLADSFFHLDRTDPTIGFAYDASVIAGATFPPRGAADPSRQPEVASVPSLDLLTTVTSDLLDIRLRLGSHLAQYLRRQLEEQKGYTSTVGVSTNKLLSKLVGNVNKPKNQTTLISPYVAALDGEESNVNQFMDGHEIGKIPGIGFKVSQKIRAHVLGREARHHDGLVYGGTRENVTVNDVRCFPGMTSQVLDQILQGPGSYKGIGGKIWGLLHGMDDTEVGKARSIPKQISIEDSYLRLDTVDHVKKELRLLAGSLIKRLHIDLTALDDEDDNTTSTEGDNDGSVRGVSGPRRWLAHPRTLRLSTRPRPPVRPDGTRTRTFTRISRSTPMPTFIFDLKEDVDVLVERFVNEALFPCFRKLHPETSGWDLSLVNIAATNMLETGGDDKEAGGRDISRMFKKQDDVLKDWKVEDIDIAPSPTDECEQRTAEDSPLASPETMELTEHLYFGQGSEDNLFYSQTTINGDDEWESGDDTSPTGNVCRICGAIMPAFAMGAHDRFHVNPD